MIKLPKINPVCRIAMGLIAMTTTIIFIASFFGFFPNIHAIKLESRRHLCEAVAKTFTTKTNTDGIQTVRELLQCTVDQNPDLLSIGVRLDDGTVLLEIEDHIAHWGLNAASKSTETEIFVPVIDGGKSWGTIETRFASIGTGGIGDLFSKYPEVALAGFVSLFGMIAFYVYLRSVLQQLNPSKVIPQRVRNAFNSLAEGVLVLDGKGQIVLANSAFQQYTGLTMEDLMGKKASQLPFASRKAADKNPEFPWVTTLAGNEEIQRQVLAFNTAGGRTIFSVSCAPILDGKGKNRGAMVSLENVTNLEFQRAELESLVGKLTESTEQVRTQNRELERLATIDPLTSCFNRRSFLAKFKAFWDTASGQDRPLSIIMVDIDHFKSVNDNHGHAVGDNVLREVSAVLLNISRECDVVCRFGGEEFAILLPETDIEFAKHIAERMRTGIEELQFKGLSVTASFGASSRIYQAGSQKELLEQADKSLYFAKRNGRNQVVDWVDVSDDVDIDESALRSGDEETCEIPFHAVTALISSLAYRDQATANHCRHVADLCVAIGEDLLGLSACFTLEVAGLLHDIGKLSLPDSILLKTDALTDEEWKIMRRHETIGIELVRTSFANEALTEIIQNFRIPYERIVEEKLETSQSAKILTIVDAYASMTANNIFRKAMSSKEAIAELVNCAGKQFDPELVTQIVIKLESKSAEIDTQHDQVSRSAALGIGIQIEQLSNALEKLDTDAIEAIANRLADTAEKDGATQIAKKSRLICELNKELTKDGENYDLIMCTIELLDMCRASQKALIEVVTID